MKSACIATEDLATILDLPPDAPERHHLETCPRCMARLATYMEFILDSSVPPGADSKEAGKSLRIAFQTAMDHAPTEAVRSRRPLRPERTWSFPWRLRPVRAFAAAAAVLIVAVGLYAGITYVRGDHEVDVLRGRSVPDGGAMGERITLLEPRAEGADAIRLRWDAASGITSYEVVVFGADLQDLARFPLLKETNCLVRKADLRPGPAPGAVIGWQVIAYRDGAAALRSPVGALRIP
jgi:hypothetical protein